MGVFFVSVFEEAVPRITTAQNGQLDAFVGMILILAWLRTGTKIDQHMAALGLTVAQAGDGLWGDMWAGRRLMQATANTARTAGRVGSNTIANGGIRGAMTQSNNPLMRNFATNSIANGVSAGSSSAMRQAVMSANTAATRNGFGAVHGQSAISAAMARYGDNTLSGVKLNGKDATLNDLKAAGYTPVGAKYTKDGGCSVDFKSPNGEDFSVNTGVPLKDENGNIRTDENGNAILAAGITGPNDEAANKALGVEMSGGSNNTIDDAEGAKEVQEACEGNNAMIPAVDENGNPILDENGNQAFVDAGSQFDENGVPKQGTMIKDQDGNVIGVANGEGGVWKAENQEEAEKIQSLAADGMIDENGNVVDEDGNVVGGGLTNGELNSAYGSEIGEGAVADGEGGGWEAQNGASSQEMQEALANGHVDSDGNLYKVDENGDHVTIGAHKESMDSSKTNGYVETEGGGSVALDSTGKAAGAVSSDDVSGNAMVAVGTSDSGATIFAPKASVGADGTVSEGAPISVSDGDGHMNSVGAYSGGKVSSVDAAGNVTGSTVKGYQGFSNAMSDRQHAAPSITLSGNKACLATDVNGNLSYHGSACYETSRGVQLAMTENAKLVNPHDEKNPGSFMLYTGTGSSFSLLPTCSYEQPMSNCMTVSAYGRDYYAVPITSTQAAVSNSASIYSSATSSGNGTAVPQFASGLGGIDRQGFKIDSAKNYAPVECDGHVCCQKLPENTGPDWSSNPVYHHFDDNTHRFVPMTEKQYNDLYTEKGIKPPQLYSEVGWNDVGYRSASSRDETTLKPLTREKYQNICSKRETPPKLYVGAHTHENNIKNAYRDSSGAVNVISNKKTGKDSEYNKGVVMYPKKQFDIDGMKTIRHNGEEYGVLEGRFDKNGRPAISEKNKQFVPKSKSTSTPKEAKNFSLKKGVFKSTKQQNRSF